MERIKRNITPQDWAALYQQEPTQEVGTYFKDEWLKPYVDDTPKFLSVYGGSDYAVTSNGGDYTVHVVIGIDHQDRMFLLDLWRKQADPREWVEAYCDLVLKWKPGFWAEEKTQITAGIGPFIERRSIERKAWIQREQFPTRGDKAMRAQSIRGRMALIGLYVPAAADGFLISAQSCWPSRPASMTTWSTPSACGPADGPLRAGLLTTDRNFRMEGRRRL